MDAHPAYELDRLGPGGRVEDLEPEASQEVGNAEADLAVVVRDEDAALG
jgi:hypothetical protein